MDGSDARSDDATTSGGPPAPEREARVQLSARERTWVVDRHQPHLTFGRATANTIVLGDSYASRHHGAILHRGGKLVVLDASTNGTLIVQENGLTIAVHREAAVLEGSGSIRLGRWEGESIAFAEVGVASPTPTAHGPGLHPPDVAPDPGRGLIRFEGDRCTIVYEGRRLLVKDLKGLRYIARLLARPNQAIDALDLFLSSVESGTEAGDVPPAAADDDGAAQRARVAVTVRIKAVLRKLEHCHPPLGSHLVAGIRTGRCCEYRTDRSNPIAWSF